MDVDDTLDLDGAEAYEEYEFPMEFTTTLKVVEAIENMRFDPGSHTKGATDLYTHADGSTKTRIRAEVQHIFEHSASSCFFAYLPLYFWRQVLYQTNQYAINKDIRASSPFTLSELIVFFGMLFFMALNDKSKFSDYWGPQPEDVIFGGITTILDGIMSLNRFKLLRRCLSFTANPTTLSKDAAARIRPLLNLLQVAGDKYVIVGRDVALDEASVACRSRQGRHLIVFEPTKPTGKYHFRLYMPCCSSSWIALIYRLHCNKSDIADRLESVVTREETQLLGAELDGVVKIRQHVLEVARPLFGSNHVLNMDNYYTSVQLLQELRIKGLYGRGTIPTNSKDFPGHTILDKKMTNVIVEI